MFCFVMYWCKVRCVAVAMAVLSVVFMLCGGATIYLTARLDDSLPWKLQSDPETELKDDQPQMDYIKRVFFIGVITLCAVTVLVALVGVVAAVYKSCCAIGLFSFCSLATAVIFLTVGSLVICVNVAAN
jgi:hypothetical protein